MWWTNKFSSSFQMKWKPNSCSKWKKTSNSLPITSSSTIPCWLESTICKQDPTLLFQTSLDSKQMSFTPFLKMITAGCMTMKNKEFSSLGSLIFWLNMEPRKSWSILSKVWSMKETQSPVSLQCNMDSVLCSLWMKDL